MKRLRTRFWIAVLSLTVLSSASGQGTFRNLDFEAADFLGAPGALAPITNALPGWTGYIGLFEVQVVGWDTVGIGGPFISVHSPVSPSPPIEGNYSVMLQSSPGSILNSSSLAQTGEIPSTARSLLYFGGLIEVSFDGQPLPAVRLGNGPNYVDWGVDVSMLAGQTGELRFIQPSLTFNAMSYLNNIRFTDRLIPEPSVFGLVGLGVLLLGWRFRKSSPHK